MMLRILIVDDDRDAGARTRDALLARGHTAHAATVATALFEAIRFVPNVIILAPAVWLEGVVLAARLRRMLIDRPLFLAAIAPAPVPASTSYDDVFDLVIEHTGDCAPLLPYLLERAQPIVARRARGN